MRYIARIVNFFASRVIIFLVFACMAILALINPKISIKIFGITYESEKLTNPWLKDS